MLPKLLFLILGLAGVGLPFDTKWHYAYALLITFVLVYGITRKFIQIKPIIAGLLLLGLAYFVPKIEIVEQQRLLVENGTIISPQQFIKNINAYPYSQTADGFLQGLGLSRKVRDVSLQNAPKYLRSGYVNKVEYNFYGPPPGLIREKLPFVVCYKIGESLIKRGFKGQGLFYWHGNFLASPTVTDINFIDKDKGENFYVFGIDQDNPALEATPHLVLNLNKSSCDQFWLLSEVCLKILALLLIAYGLFHIQRKSLDWREMLVLLCWFGYLLTILYKILWVDIFACGGNDGIIHSGFPYAMLESLSRGEWLKVLQSPEAIFYYMPGMRYLRFLEMLIFGDAYPLQLMVLIFTPVIYYRLIKTLLTPYYALVICLIMATSVLKFIGVGFYIHTHSFVKLYGEGFAYSCLFGALLILLRGISSRVQGLSCFGLFAVALSIRPNLGVMVCCLVLAYFFLPSFSNANKQDKFVDLLGMAPLVLIPLHNLYFGQQLVLLTAAMEISENLPLHPKMYLSAITSLGGLISPFAFKQNFISHFNYLGISVLLLMLLNLKIGLSYRLHNKIGTLAVACFFGLGVHLFYAAQIRYMQPYFLLSMLLCLVIIKDRKNLATAS